MASKQALLEISEVQKYPEVFYRIKKGHPNILASVRYTEVQRDLAYGSESRYEEVHILILEGDSEELDNVMVWLRTESVFKQEPEILFEIDHEVDEFEFLRTIVPWQVQLIDMPTVATYLEDFLCDNSVPTTGDKSIQKVYEELESVITRLGL